MFYCIHWGIYNLQLQIKPICCQSMRTEGLIVFPAAQKLIQTTLMQVGKNCLLHSWVVSITTTMSADRSIGSHYQRCFRTTFGSLIDRTDSASMTRSNRFKMAASQQASGEALDRLSMEPLARWTGRTDLIKLASYL